MAARGMEANAVPTTVIGELVWVGFSDAVASQIRSTVLPTDPEPGDAPDVVDIPVIGSVETGSASLLASTFFIALIDGLNPCSLGVLSILLGLVLRTGTRRQVLAIGGTFLLVTSVLYGVYIAGMHGAPLRHLPSDLDPRRSCRGRADSRADQSEGLLDGQRWVHPLDSRPCETRHLSEDEEHRRSFDDHRCCPGRHRSCWRSGSP